MRLPFLIQLCTLAATSLAYNCTSYNFPTNVIGLPCQNTSSVEISDKIIDANSEGMGSAHVWGNPGGLIPWERDENNLFTIYYCFVRDYDRENIGDTVEAAIEEWWSEIGRAGPRSGHGLAMKEVIDEDGNPVYCMDSTAEDVWNDKVPYETLPIQYTGGTEGGCSSTIGLIRTDPLTHWNMRLSIDAPHLNQDTMHELGHVFGMEHEHQRTDRDKYIQVLYKNLRDHEHCHQKAKIQEPDITEDELCLDYKKAAHYGCMRCEYVKDTNRNDQKIKAGSKEFDYKSIVMYDSFDGAENDCLDNFVGCPLARWIDPENHGKGIDRVKIHRGIVSDLDYEWIKKTYPYKEPPKRVKSSDPEISVRS